jgi:glycosyltransferase involved in cell wall biosynthesis
MMCATSVWRHTNQRVNSQPARQVRVAIVCDGIGDVVAGSFISTARFAELLRARGHHVTLVSSGSLGRRDAEFRGMAMHRFAGPLIPWSDGRLYLGLPWPRRVRRIFEAAHIEIVHVMVPLLLGLAAVRIGKARGLPVIIHSHTQPENIFMNSPPFPGRDTLHRKFCDYLNWLYKQADVMIYPSTFACRQFPELAGRRHAIISNGVDAARFKPTAPDAFIRRFNLSTSGPRLMYLGRLHKEKNVSTLIAAMPAIRERHQRAQLYLIGLGYEQPSLADQARRLGVGDAVTFCGFVPDDELPAAISGADLAVLPSMAELEGMAVLEAMACGKPVLIADAKYSAATDFVHGNGLLFKAGDARDLAAQACTLLDSPQTLRRLGARSFEMSRRFDIHESARAIETIYTSLLAPV